MQLIALPAIAFGALFVAIAAEAMKERRLPEKEVEREENWNWPKREAGPVGRERLP